VPLRGMRNQADLFREANVPLMTELAKLGNEYDKITGGMKADWAGEEKQSEPTQTLCCATETALRASEPGRQMMALWAEKRAELNDIYARMLALRRQVAENAGCPTSATTPSAPITASTTRPTTASASTTPSRPWSCPPPPVSMSDGAAQLGWTGYSRGTWPLTRSTQPPLAPYRARMNSFRAASTSSSTSIPAWLASSPRWPRRTYSTWTRGPARLWAAIAAAFVWRQRPYIFMNGVGSHDDVQTMLHEAGHAFHAFESFALPYIWQTDVPMEFCEVASMGMELLAAPYLTRILTASTPRPKRHGRVSST
jgi:oligoendopeptidase F